MFDQRRSGLEVWERAGIGKGRKPLLPVEKDDMLHEIKIICHQPAGKTPNGGLPVSWAVL